MPILCAEDDPDDRLLTRDAVMASRAAMELTFVEDGAELLDYLKRRGRHARDPGVIRPALILLDLNMPRMDGREALREIKSDPDLRQIPVIVLTTSSSEGDVFRSYDLGANSYIVKPVTFESLVRVMRELSSYWTEMAALPSAPYGQRA